MNTPRMYPPTLAIHPIRSGGGADSISGGASSAVFSARLEEDSAAAEYVYVSESAIALQEIQELEVCFLRFTSATTNFICSSTVRYREYCMNSYIFKIYFRRL